MTSVPTSPPDDERPTTEPAGRIQNQPTPAPGPAVVDPSTIMTAIRIAFANEQVAESDPETTRLALQVELARINAERDLELGWIAVRTKIEAKNAASNAAMHKQIVPLALIGAMALLALCALFLFSDAKEVLVEVVRAVLAFLAGLGAGYGVSRATADGKRNSDRNSTDDE
ncbi:MAG: hypothetical protein ACRC1K_23775 [Planctomycetia bacterium]